jgi:hypothetical protein
MWKRSSPQDIEKARRSSNLKNESPEVGIFLYHLRAVASDQIDRADYNWMMPRRTAMATACVRSLAPNFSMMCLT